MFPMPAEDTSTPIMTTSQVTTNFSGPPSVAEPPAADPLRPPPKPGATADQLKAAAAVTGDETRNEAAGKGIEGEEVVWEARYAMKNFLGRLVFRTLLTIGWMALAVYTWGYSDGSLALLTIIAGVALLALWAQIIYRIIQARFGHYYRLTTRRLFISTGLMRRRRDMMELLRVKDVFTRQTLVERWLSLGTVVVVCSDRDLPTFYIAGVDDPKRVMDLIWHHARAEREGRSVIVDNV